MARLHFRYVPSLALCCAALLTGACSGQEGGGASSLITGSVFSSAPKAAPASVDDPATRPSKIAMVSASAVKCGFYFDPAKLRQSFMSSQAAGGDATKVQQSYDNSFARTAKALAAADDFCTPNRIADIKSDLNRHLAGDFTVVAKADRGPKQQSAWEWLVDGGQKADSGKMDPNAIFFPSGGAQSTVERH